tara:strand:+ start:6426 stop:7175 length:750 start_codon:yes stop_codon:yes gene_type:complete
MASLTTATRPAINVWLKESNNPRPYDFAPGDLIHWKDPMTYGDNAIGEVTNIGSNGRGGIQLMVDKLEREMQGSKIWKFNELTCNRIVQPEEVLRHVSHDPALGALTKKRVREGWEKLGFAVGCEKYCLKVHVNEVHLDVAPGDSDDEEEADVVDENGIHPEMADFIVPDDEGEAWCAPDPKNLTDEQRKWVNQTHAAVRDWENWVPKDQSEQAVKDFVDNMTAKYSIKEDERQFTSGAGSEFSKPSDI